MTDTKDKKLAVFGLFNDVDSLGRAVAALAAAGFANSDIAALHKVPEDTTLGMGIPEHEARRYEAFLRAGGALLSVHCSDAEWARRARSIMDGFGATDVDKTREARVPDPDRHAHR